MVRDKGYVCAYVCLYKDPQVILFLQVEKLCLTGCVPNKPYFPQSFIQIILADGVPLKQSTVLQYCKSQTRQRMSKIKGAFPPCHTKIWPLNSKGL